MLTQQEGLQNSHDLHCFPKAELPVGLRWSLDIPDWLDVGVL